MVQQVHIFLAHLIKVIFPFDAHGRDFYPVAVLPVRAGCGNLTEIDFRVKVGGERIAVIAAVAVQNIDGIDLIEKMFLSICAVSLSNARVKTGTEKSSQTCFFKFFFVCPLPGIIKVSGKSFLFAAFVVNFSPFRVVQISSGS